MTPAAGAGHGDEGDASFQGPAQEQIDTLPAQPKPTHADDASSVIALAARIAKPETVETTARATSGLVMTRPKPEKRLNAKDRAKARRAKDKPEAAEVAAAVIPEASGLSTAHPKPEKRKNAKERAKEKYAKAKTEDGITPDTTAKAKSKVEAKAETKKAKKAKQSKAAKAA